MKIFSPIFSSISFIVLGFIFRSVIHFELLLIHTSWYGLMLSLSLLFFLVHGISQARILEWVAMPHLLQGIFPIQGLNPGLLHCRWILYHLCHQGSPWILEWVAIPYPGYLSNPGIELGSPALQADSLPSELPGKSLCLAMWISSCFSIICWRNCPLFIKLPLLFVKNQLPMFIWVLVSIVHRMGKRGWRLSRAYNL